MKKTTPAASPDIYVAALRGWRKDLVEMLRGSVLSTGKLDDALNKELGDPTILSN
jgi:hypothetical protein